MKKFYGFEYRDGVNTTTGQPNEGFERFHGRLSIAGLAHLFESEKERREWVNASGFGSYGGRVAVNRAKLRRLHAGMTNERFGELLEILELENDQQREARNEN